MDVGLVGNVNVTLIDVARKRKRASERRDTNYDGIEAGRWTPQNTRVFQATLRHCE